MLCVYLGWVGMAPYFVTYISSYFVICLNHMVQERIFVRKTLALQVGPFVWKTIAKHDILI
jgi:hypothetical protein